MKSKKFHRLEQTVYLLYLDLLNDGTRLTVYDFFKLHSLIHPSIHLLVHSFNKYWLDSNHMPFSVFRAGSQS